MPDLVERDFTADAPDRLWVADITHIPTWAGFLYLAVVLDAFSRRVVGWSMANHLRTQLVLDALDMALWQRRPDGVIHHSDQGSQYTSLAFGKRCRDAGVRPSTGSVGDCYDNAMCESFFATLECELLERRRFRSHAEARMAVFEFIEGWYNPRRRHSAIGYLSPVNYETEPATPRSPKSITVHETGSTPQPWLEKYWPRPAARNTPGTSKAIVEMLANCGDAFPQATAWALEHLRSFEGSLFRLQRSGQAGQHPEATLEVLVRVIGPNGLPPQHRYTLREILDEMKEAMPEMERDPQFQRLYRVATH